MNREWKEVKLGDVAEIKGGKRLPKGTNLIKEQNLHPYIKVKDMNGGKYIKLNDNFEFVDVETHKKIARYIVGEGDLIISIVGTIGLVSKVHKSLNSANLTENCVKIINLRNVESDYLYYVLTSRHGQNEMTKGTVGSTQPKLPIYNIEKIEFPLPPLNEQKAIAHIFSALDEKIEVNNQINKKLEEMAQTIFKHWFVDFEFPNENGEPYKSSGGEMIESELGIIPKGWEVKQLNDIASMKNGVNYSRKQEGNEVKVINVRDFDGSLISNKSKLDSILLPERQINDYLLEKYDTVVVRSAKPGETLLVFETDEVVYSGFTIRVRANEELLKLFIFYSIRNAMRMLNNSSNGTVFKNLNQQILGSLKVIVPKSNIIDMYSSLIVSLLELINEKIKETEKLKQLRDTLLPKLMSGEIRVPLDEGDIL